MLSLTCFKQKIQGPFVCPYCTKPISICQLSPTRRCTFACSDVLRLQGCIALLRATKPYLDHGRMCCLPAAVCLSRRPRGVQSTQAGRGLQVLLRSLQYTHHQNALQSKVPRTIISRCPVADQSSAGVSQKPWLFSVESFYPYSTSATTFFLRADFTFTLPGALCAILLLCFLLPASVIVRLSFAACDSTVMLEAPLEALESHQTS